MKAHVQEKYSQDLSGKHIGILSYSDMHYYLIAVLHQQHKELLRDEVQQPLRFNSQLQAQEWLKLQGVHQATLVMISAYDEMIGNDVSRGECYLECQF